MRRAIKVVAAVALILLGLLLVFILRGVVIMHENNQLNISGLSIPDVKYMNTYFTTRPPDGVYDLALAQRKGLCGEAKFDKKYLYLQALYEKSLSAYFNQKLDLAKYDKLINQSNLNFKPEKGTSSGGLNSQYIYLINTAYIERLDKTDIKVLEEHLSVTGGAVDDELVNLAAKTYPSVLDADLGTKNDYRPRDRIVNLSWSNPLFGVAFQKYSASGEFYAEDYPKQSAFINSLIPQMETDFLKELNHPTAVFLRQ